MTTTLDLRPLKEPQRLQAVNEAVAVHCEGWTWEKNPKRGKLQHEGVFVNADKTIRVTKWKDGQYGGTWLVPKFATSADAVLPLLEKKREVSNVFENGEWFVGIAQGKTETEFFSATAPTFPLAACLALLRASGVEVLT